MQPASSAEDSPPASDANPPTPPQQPQLRRSTRNRRPPDRHGEYVTHAISARGRAVSREGSGVTTTRCDGPSPGIVGPDSH